MLGKSNHVSHGQCVGCPLYVDQCWVLVIFLYTCISEAINMGNIILSKVFIGCVFMLRKDTQIIRLEKTYRGPSSRKLTQPDRAKKEKNKQKRTPYTKNGYYENHIIKSNIFFHRRFHYSKSIYYKFKHNLIALGNHGSYTINTKTSKS